MCSKYYVDVPPQLIEDAVTVWEGTTDRTISITHSNLKVNDITWSKDGSDISIDMPKVNFETITFGEIRKEDAGTYFFNFALICFEKIGQFRFSFTLDVLCELLCDNV